MNSTDSYTQINALKLFTALVNKDQGVTEAQKVIDPLKKTNTYLANKLQAALDAAQQRAKEREKKKIEEQSKKESTAEIKEEKVSKETKEEKKTATQTSQNESWLCPHPCNTKNKAAEKVCITCGKSKPTP